MARQVVSYDDLAPTFIQQEATSPGLAAGSSKGTSQQDAANGVGSISPVINKRRRDEELDGDSVPPKSEETSITVGDVGRKAITTDIVSFQSLPPRPQVKKRRKNKQRFGGGGGTGMNAAASEAPYNNAPGYPIAQHWDDPGIQTDGISYDESGTEINGVGYNLNDNSRKNEEEGEGDMDIEGTEDIGEDEDAEDDSRELTHEEVWDDSALIAAWDAANEEYEAIHGKNKRWKKERVHKSPLWYNIPPEKSADSLNKKKTKSKRKVESISTEADVEVDSSVPQDFETYVPTHDPSLAFPGPSSPPTVPQPTKARLQEIADQYSSILPAPQFANSQGSRNVPTSADLAFPGAAGVSADEAFSRALGAMYWCGYWTAVYHAQRINEKDGSFPVKDLEGEDVAEEHEEEETEELVSAQR